MMRISKLLCKSFALLSLLFIACSNTDDIQQKVTEIDASQLKVRDPFIFYDADTDYYYLHVNGTLKVKCIQEQRSAYLAGEWIFISPFCRILGKRRLLGSRFL